MWQPQTVDRLQRLASFGAKTPGAIGQIVKCKWYNYYSDGQNPTTCCDSGEYYYFYDALGNVNGVLDDGGHYYRWEMDAFGNDLPSENSFLDMDQPGPKEHLTGKMFDTTTALYYFAARWYDPEVGRFVGPDPLPRKGHSDYAMSSCRPTALIDPSGANPFDPNPYLLYPPLIPSKKDPVCAKNERMIEWFTVIKPEILIGNVENNVFRRQGCVDRATNIAKRISRTELCCFDIAVMDRYSIIYIIAHGVSIVRAKVTNPVPTKWTYWGNAVIDDWQFGATPLTGFGFPETYSMAEFLLLFPIPGTITEY